VKDYSLQDKLVCKLEHYCNLHKVGMKKIISITVIYQGTGIFDPHT